MTSLNRKIKELRMIHNMTQQELGDKLGVVKSAVSNWENGHNRPDQKTILELSRLFDVSVDYLTMDELDIFNKEPSFDAVPIPVIEKFDKEKGTIFNKTISGYEYISDSELKSNPYRYFFLRVENDDMEGAMIHEDNLVLVKQVKTLTNADIGLISYKEKTLIRRYLDFGDKVVLVAEPYNKIIEPIKITDRSEIQIEGKILEARIKLGEDV